MSDYRKPEYVSDADYNTNAPSYYEDLARKQGLIKELANRIWGYEETLNLTLADIAQRFIEWDGKIAAFDGNVNVLLQEWIADGTFDHIINDTIFSWKADIDYVDSEIAQVASGAPKGTYTTLANLQSAFPTGDTGNYLVETTGNIHNWNGSIWRDTGIKYLSSGIADRSIGAKKLGVTGVNPENTTFFTIPKNRFNIDTMVHGYYVNWGNGELVASTTYGSSDYILVDPNTQYSFVANPDIRLAYYDEKKVWISGISAPTSPLTTPSNAVYLRFSDFKTKMLLHQIEKGSSVTPYVKGGDELQYNKLPSTLKTFIDTPLKDTTINGIVNSKNIYNQDTNKLDENLNNANGFTTPVVGYSTSDFIIVKPSTNYVFNKDFAPEQFNYVFYDSNKTYISGQRFLTGFTEPFLLSPVNAKYIRFSCKTSKMTSGVQLEEGTLVTPFEPFYKYFDWYKEKEIDTTNVDTAYLDDLVSVTYSVASKTFIFYKQCKYGDGLNYLGTKFVNHVNTTNNVNVWVLLDVNLYRKSDDGTFILSVERLVGSSEWTCAIFETGAADFIGGANHGHENKLSTVILLDGKKMSLTSDYTGKCKEVEILLTSMLNKHSVVSENVATHDTHILINAEKLITEQQVTFLKSMILKTSYLTMFGVTRNLGATSSTTDVTGLPYVTNEGFKDVGYDVLNLSFGHNDVAVKGVKDATLYNNGVGHKFKARVTVLESNELPESKMRFEKVPSYNKFYYDYCGDGYVTQIGEVWKNKASYVYDYSGVE